MLAAVDAANRRHPAAARDDEKLVGAFALGVGAANLKKVQLQPYLTDVVVHAIHHETAHGLRHHRIDKVRAVLVGRSRALVLEQAADAKAGGAGALWRAAPVSTVRRGVAGAVELGRRGAHDVGEGDHGEQAEKSTVPIAVAANRPLSLYNNPVRCFRPISDGNIRIDLD